MRGRRSRPRTQSTWSDPETGFGWNVTCEHRPRSAHRRRRRSRNRSAVYFRASTTAACPRP
eukprot:scaffold3159_cov79-Isochrysis_galbana.AAC.1